MSEPSGMLEMFPIWATGRAIHDVNQSSACLLPHPQCLIASHFRRASAALLGEATKLLHL